MINKKNNGYIDPTKPPFYMDMEEWKKLMGYDKLWYRIRKKFFAIIRPYKKGKI